MFSRTLTVAALAVALMGGAALLAQARKDFVVPDIPGFVTLKGDFHVHTTQSDGSVLPPVRVIEAWRDGLDVIAITDHLEFPTPVPDPEPDANRSYDQARAEADRRGLILIRAAEITAPMPPGHVNALFLNDVNALKQPDIASAFRAAAAQGAFFVWNHPGWKAQQPDVTRWFPEHTDLYARGWLNGVEVGNERESYAVAQQWAAEKQLTVFANSDVHDLTEFLYARDKGERRFMTLVFATERTEHGVRDALGERRTAAYYDETLSGEARELRPLVLASLRVATPRVSVSAEGAATVLLTNMSDIPFRLSAVKGGPFTVAAIEPVGPRSTVVLSLAGFKGLETGEHDCVLRLEAANVLVGSGTPLVFDLPFKAFTWDRVRVAPDTANRWRIEGGTAPAPLDIRYTLDGTAPTPASTPVSQPFTASDPARIALAAFRDGRQVGEVWKGQFELHAAVARPVTLAKPPAERYAGDGAASLTDGRRGSPRFADGRWLGFQKEDLDAVVEFAAPLTAKTISVTFLESTRSWIFLPTEVEFLASADGVRYERIGKTTFPAAAEGRSRAVVAATMQPKAAFRYLRIVARNVGVCPPWHRSAGQPAWLFVDEIAVR
jgi:hypothetical protein